MKYTLDVFPFAQSGFNSLQNELFQKNYFVRIVPLETLLTNILKST